MRAMLEANPIGVLRGDVHGRILDANDALLRLAGGDRAALAAGTLRWDALTPPEWLPADAAGIAEAREKGACTPYEKEYQRPMAAGCRCWSASPWWGRRGRTPSPSSST